MKTRIIFLILLIANFSCSPNKSVSDAEKDKIKGEVKEVVNTIFKGCEEANFDMTMESWLDSPDLLFVFNGAAMNYQGVVDAMKPIFNTLINQEVKINDEKYVFLDKSTVIYTTNCTFLENYKDGHAVLSDPLVMQFTFVKINDEWKVINGVESSVRQNVTNTETSSKLNQVECINQLIGSWKFEIGKDTTGYADFTNYGTGVDVIMKFVSKGKTFMENRINWAYDKTLNRIIGLTQTKGGDVVSLYSVEWISKNKYILVGFKDIFNPEEASMRAEGTLKSNDLVEIIYYENNKPVNTDTWTRVK